MYTRIIAADPGITWAYLRRGDLYRDARNWRLALTDYSSYLEQHADNAAVLVRRGRIYLRLNQPSQAVEDFKEALRISPKLWTGWHELGHAYERLRRWEEAIDSFTTASDAEPNDVSHRRCRGVAWARQAAWDRAAADLRAAQSLCGSPSKFRDAHELALVQLAAGDTAAYEESCRDLLERFGESAPTTIGMVCWTCALGTAPPVDYEVALASVEKFLEEQPSNNAIALVARGRAANAARATR